MSEVDNKLAAVVKEQARIAALEAEIAKAKKALFVAQKASKTPEIEKLKETEKGMLSVYFNFQRWPVTLGKEALTLLYSDDMVAEMRSRAAKLPSYAERKAQGLVDEK